MWVIWLIYHKQQDFGKQQQNKENPEAAEASHDLVQARDEVPHTRSRRTGGERRANINDDTN